MPMLKIHNVETGEIKEIDLTSTEVKAVEDATKAADAAAVLRAEERKTAYDAKKTLLEKLGITEEEAKLLLG